MTWTVVTSDNFNRANTTAGGAGTTTGVGNGWTDTYGGLWNITSDELTGSTPGTTYGWQTLLRPSGEALQDSRVVVTLDGRTNACCGPVLRAVPGGGPSGPSGGTNYFCFIAPSGGTIELYKSVSNSVGSIAGPTGLTGGFVSGHSYTVDFSAVGISPTNLSIIVTDLTTSTVVATLSTTDSTSALQTTGVQGVMGFTNGGLSSEYVSNITTYSGGPSQNVNVNTPATQVAGASFTVSGTYSNGTPTALDYEFDSAGYTLVTSPTIGSGSYSFSVTAPAAGSHTISVRDHSTSVSGTSGSFTVNAPPSETISVITPSNHVAGTVFTIAGTYANATPTALDYQFGSGAFVAASSPTISGGAYSFASTAPAVGTYTVTVRDHTTSVSGTSPGSFSTTSSPASITISPNTATAGQTNLTLTITGTGTAFTGSPFSISGGAGALLVSQSVASATSGSVVIDTGLAGFGSITVVDSISGQSATLTVTTPSRGALNIGWLGDSITSGYLSNPVTDAVTYLTNQGYTVTSTNRGVLGTSTADWAPSGATFTNALAAFVAAGTTIVHVLLGTNDARTPNSFSTATHFANMTLIVNALVAAGLKVIISKPLFTVPNVGTGGQIWPNDPASVYQAYHSADMALIDGVNVFQGDTGGFQLSALSPTTFLGDGIHPVSITGVNTMGNFWAIGILRKVGGAPSAVLVHKWTHF